MTGADLIRGTAQERGVLSGREQRAAEEVYLNHAPGLARFAIGLVGVDAAQDVVATAVAKSLASRNWDSLRDPRAYLFRAVFNESRTHYRRKATWARIVGLRTGTVELATQDHSSGTADLVTVRDALRRLPPRQRAVCLLVYWEDMTIQDTALILAISEGSVKKHLARARSRLRKELQDGF